MDQFYPIADRDILGSRNMKGRKRTISAIASILLGVATAIPQAAAYVPLVAQILAIFGLYAVADPAVKGIVDKLTNSRK